MTDEHRETLRNLLVVFKDGLLPSDCEAIEAALRAPEGGPVMREFLDAVANRACRNSPHCGMDLPDATPPTPPPADLVALHTEYREAHVAFVALSGRQWGPLVEIAQERRKKAYNALLAWTPAAPADGRCEPDEHEWEHDGSSGDWCVRCFVSRRDIDAAYAARLAPAAPVPAQAGEPTPCPHCSFDPTSLNDYCDEHRPALAVPPVAPITKATSPESQDYWRFIEKTAQESRDERPSWAAPPVAQEPGIDWSLTHERCPKCGTSGLLGQTMALRHDNGQRHCLKCDTRLESFAPPAPQESPTIAYRPKVGEQVDYGARIRMAVTGDTADYIMTADGFIPRADITAVHAWVNDEEGWSTVWRRPTPGAPR